MGFAGVATVSITLSATHDISQAQELGEIFGGLLTMHVSDHVKALNTYAESVRSPIWSRRKSFEQRELRISCSLRIWASLLSPLSWDELMRLLKHFSALRERPLKILNVES